MAITRRTPATTAIANTALGVYYTVNKPTGLTEGDRAFAYIGAKYITMSDPSMKTDDGVTQEQWTLIGRYEANYGSAGNDAGPTVGFLFGKTVTTLDVDAAATWGVGVMSGTVANSWTAISIAYVTTANWKDTIANTPVGHFADSTTTPTNNLITKLATTASFTSYITAGDAFVAFATIPTDAAASITDTSLTWTGTGFSTSQAPTISYIETVQGQDSTSVAGYWDTVTGTATAYDPSTLSWTLNANVNSYGVILGVLVREQSGQSINLGAPSGYPETNTAQMIHEAKSLAQVTSSETALAITRLIEVTVSEAISTEVAQAITFERSYLIIQAVDVEELLPLSPTHGYDLTQAAEENTAGIITLPQPQNIDVGQAVDSDIAQVMTTTRDYLLGQVWETAQSQSLTVSADYQLGLVEETAQSQALSSARDYSLSQAVETAQGQPLTVARDYQLSHAAETDYAGVISAQPEIRVQIITALDAQTAQPATADKLQGLSFSSEIQTAQTVAVERAFGLSLAEETQEAQSVALTRGEDVVQAEETDVALGVSAHKSYGVSGVVEDELTPLLSVVKTYLVTQTEDAHSATAVTIFQDLPDLRDITITITPLDLEYLTAVPWIAISAGVLTRDPHLTENPWRSETTSAAPDTRTETSAVVSQWATTGPEL